MTSNNSQSNQLSEPQKYVDLLSTPEKLDRVADMVTQGELPFPIGLAPDQVEKLAFEVRKRRRRRLVQYIARSIAMDIHLASGP